MAEAERKSDRALIQLVRDAIDEEKEGERESRELAGNCPVCLCLCLSAFGSLMFRQQTTLWFWRQFVGCAFSSTSDSVGCAVEQRKCRKNGEADGPRILCCQLIAAFSLKRS